MASPRPESHDQDLLLARVLQEQERAFHAFAELAHANKTPTREYQQQQQQLHQPSEEELSDEELARRLQEQEDEEAYAEGAEYGYDVEEEVDYDQLSYEEYNAIGDVAGAVSKGLAAHLIQQLPRVPASKHMQHQQQQQQGQQDAGAAAPQADTAAQGTDCSACTAASSMCVVCQCDFEASEELKVLPGCGHAYHADCIDTWLAGSKDCPICHKEVTLEAVSAATDRTTTNQRL